MHRLALFLVFGLLAPSVLAAIPDSTIHVRKTIAPIRIDGIVDAAWSEADSTSDFFQLSPYYGKPPLSHTVVKVLSTDDAFYCLMLCYEERASIDEITGMLDQVNGDNAALMLDTFNDHQTAYQFVVSAAGVRSDARLVDDARNRDYSWDGVWFAGTQVYDWGYAVEFGIPYKSIRYDGTVSTWGVDFSRFVASSHEDVYWRRYGQNEGQRVSGFGKIAFEGFRPTATGMNLEIYPVGIARAKYLRAGKYKLDPDAGIDIFYNPSEKLTFQLTANPDFAQIEADPFQFNITRYETFFDERRPFFTEGNEVFMASGRQSNSGFYRPLQLFYSRRIGKVVDGEQVPLQVGTKAFGRLGEWEYGGFYARTAETDYLENGAAKTEPGASFVSGRVKKHIFGNSSIGVLFVGKTSQGRTDGVVDIDGAFRSPSWQLSYQAARSINGAKGDYAASAGFVMFKEHWVNFTRLRAVGNDFDVSQVGYVPWRGTAQVTALTGPNWNFETGWLQSFLLYMGGSFNYEHADLYTDRSAHVGFDFQFRDNWGGEVNLDAGRNKDAGTTYNGHEASLSLWFNTSPRLNANFNTGYARTYNFARGYVAPYLWVGGQIAWKPLTTIETGSSFSADIEKTPQHTLEEITYNARPFISFTPINDLNVRVYTDILVFRSTGRIEQVITGLLFSYSFLPKSWIYLALNEVRQQQSLALEDPTTPRRLRVTDRAAVAKVKYLYYL